MRDDLAKKLVRAEGLTRQLEARLRHTSPPLIIDPAARTSLKLWIATGSPSKPSHRSDTIPPIGQDEDTEVRP